MIGLLFGTFFGIILTFSSIAFSILYVLKLLSRSQSAPPQGHYIVSPTKDDELDSSFKPLKEASAAIPKKAWVKLEYRDPKKEGGLTFIQLKANMLFQFQNEESDVCIGACSLDDCHVDVEYRSPKRESPIWRRNNGLILSCATRDLLPGHQTLVIYFKTGRELEEWFYACQRSANLRKSKTIEQQKQQEYWTQLSSKLTNTSVQGNPDWLIAVASRFFYNIYDSQNFLNMVLKHLRRKVNQFPKPSYLSDITVSSLYFGPNLPRIKSVRLISLSNDGATELAAELSYDGGFRIRIELTFKISFPGSRVIYIPVVLVATIQRLAGKIHLHCDAPPASCFWLGFYAEPEIDLKIDTEIGETYKIKQIPRLATIIINQLKQQIVENMLLPNMADLPLPKIPNPLRRFRPPLKKIESEPILKANNKLIYLEEENPSQSHKDLLETVDKQLLDFVEAESNKNKENNNNK